MTDILVLFASKGDEKAFKPVREFLDKHHIKYDFRMASAHKTPKDVEDILKKQYSVIITGAGLAAALPGVVAANVLCPVIGVPCSGNLEGLDALLAIMQMPPGVPVLCTGVDKGEVAAQMALLMFAKRQKVMLIGEQSPVMKKAEDLIASFGIRTQLAAHPMEDELNIVFTSLDEVPKAKGITLYCPIVAQQDDKAELALQILRQTAQGLWVGLNNATNAAIGSVEILNSDGHLTQKLHAYRQEQADKVRAYTR